MTSQIEQLLFDYKEAAHRLNVSRRWLMDKVQAGEVPHRRLGRLVRFTPADLDQIIENSERGCAR